MPKERTFRRDSSPDGDNQTAAQISMDDMTGSPEPTLASEPDKPVWSDDGEEVST